MPGKKKKYNARFPPARIKKIMQSDEEVGKVAAAVPVIISRALELFVDNLLTKANNVANHRRSRTLTPSHIKLCIQSEKRFDFLKELVASVPDLQGDSDLDGSALNTPSSSSSHSHKEFVFPNTTTSQPTPSPEDEDEANGNQVKSTPNRIEPQHRLSRVSSSNHKSTSSNKRRGRPPKKSASPPDPIQPKPKKLPKLAPAPTSSASTNGSNSSGNNATTAATSAAGFQYYQDKHYLETTTARNVGHVCDEEEDDDMPTAAEKKPYPVNGTNGNSGGGCDVALDLSRNGCANELTLPAIDGATVSLVTAAAKAKSTTEAGNNDGCDGTLVIDEDYDC